MKSKYLWCFFIILVNQENTIDGQQDPLLHCYETDEQKCYGRQDWVDTRNKQAFFECVRDAPEKERACGLREGYVCGKVELFFDTNDKVTFAGCERRDKMHPQLCTKRRDMKENKWDKKFGKTFKTHNCSSCEGDMCNSKHPPTEAPTSTSPSASPKKEQKSENSGLSPNMVLLMLLVLLIFSF